MDTREVIDLGVYITERSDLTESELSAITPGGHAEGCARGKHIWEWLKARHKPRKRYLRWLSDNDGACECQFMINVLPGALQWELSHICAWCEGEIPEDTEVFALSAKARKEAYIAGYSASASATGQSGACLFGHNRFRSQKAGLGHRPCRVQRGVRPVAKGGLETRDRRV